MIRWGVMEDIVQMLVHGHNLCFDFIIPGSMNSSIPILIDVVIKDEHT